MSEHKKINKLFNISARARVILAAVIIVGVLAGTFFTWHHYHQKSSYVAAAHVSGGPDIQSIPGAGNPSDRYVQTQNLQNNLLAEKARQSAGSSIPTVTRPNFMGNLSQFGESAPSHSKNTARPKNCPIKKVVVMFRPNPANCAINNLKIARQAGVTAEELACQGCSLPALKMAGYTAGDLKNVGYSAAQLKAAGYDLNQLEQAGFNAHQLKNAGFLAKQLAKTGYTAGELAVAGYTPSQMAAAGFSPSDLTKVGLNQPACRIDALRKARSQGIFSATLKKEGCGIAALKAAGYRAAELKAAGFNAQSLKAVGFSAKALADAGFTATDLKKAGYSAAELKAAGDSAMALKQAGFSDQALKAAGFKPQQIKQADKAIAAKICDVDHIKAQRAQHITATALKKEGCGIAALKAAGYTADELRKAGFNAAQLKAAGFSAQQLRKAGFTAKQLKAAGYSAADLKQAGFSVKQLLDSGYLAAALKRNGISAAALKNAGLTAQQLKAAGFSPLETGSKGAVPKACRVAQLKKEREQGVSAIKLRKKACSLAALKAAGFTAAELRAAGFTARQLHSVGFTATELKAAGFTASELKAAGFTAAELEALGYSANALKEAGYSAAALRAAGVTAADLKAAGLNAKQLKAAGYSAHALKQAGFSASWLKNAGFNAGQLAVAGFSAQKLHHADFSAQQLREAGLSAAQLKQAGYSVATLKRAGYSDGDLLRAGFTPKQSSNSALTKQPQNSRFVRPTYSHSQPKKEDENTAPSMPNLNSPEARLAAMVRASNADRSEQQRQDQVQKLQGGMSMQANRMLAEWSGHLSQSMKEAEPPKQVTSPAAHKSPLESTAENVVPGTVMKAGSVMFAVLDTSVNSDEKSPIMASIVDGPLKGSKLIGRFTRVNQRVLLSFNLLNDPNYYKSLSLNAVAIDPNTARTAISGEVNNHYLLRYGTVFATAFLSGLSDAVLQSSASNQCGWFGCVSHFNPLNTRQQVLVGLGTAGQKIATNFGDKFSNLPPTVKIKGGTGIGILIMSDLKLPVGAVSSHKDQGK